MSQPQERPAASAPAIRAGSLPGKILVVRLGAIGDVVNALVFAAAVKDASPTTRIGWTVHELSRPLVEANPVVDRVHVWKRASGLAGLRVLVRELRGERYDLAVDLQRITKSALVARLAGAPRVLGYDRARTKELAGWLSTERIARGAPHEHMVEQVLAFARHLGIESPAVRHALPCDEAAERWADEFAQRANGPLVLVGLGASKPENRWPPTRFGELARALAGDGARIVLSGGPGDAAAGEAAREALHGLACEDLVGRTSLLELAALLRRARLFVGGDTGPMHIAAAVGCPVVALFGPADPRRTGPWGAGHRVVKPGEGSRRMEAITVHAVLDAVRGGLTGAPPSRLAPV
jgi:heptosyltransferase-1